MGSIDVTSRATRDPLPWLEALIAFTGLVLLSVGIHHYYGFLSDDALISLRYVARWLGGHGLTWDDFHPVEGYTNFLWVMSLSAWGALGLDLVHGVRVLGTASTVALFPLLYVAARPNRAEGLPSLLPLAGAFWMLGLSGNVLAWSIGGLEQAQLAAILVAAMLSVFRACEEPSRGALALAGGLHAVLVLTRPDSILFCGASFLAMLGLMSTMAWRLRGAFWIGASSAAAMTAKVGFSQLYYGEWVPNSAYVKLALSEVRIRGGWWYLSDYLSAARGLYGLLLVYLVALALLRRLRGKNVAYLAITWLTWATYVVAIGGDRFPAHRHGVVLTVLACLTLVVAGTPARVTRGAWWLTLVLGGAALLGYRNDQLHAEYNRFAEIERWEFDCAKFARHLTEAFGTEAPLIAVEAAGCMGYFTDFPALDLFGINDWTIARNRPPDVGTGDIGHEFGRSYADAQYLWERQPDLLVHHIGVPGQPFFAAYDTPDHPDGMRLNAAFYEVRAWTQHGDYYLWMNRESPLLEVKSTAGTLRVPGIALREREPTDGWTTWVQTAHGDFAHQLRGESLLRARAVPSGRYLVRAVTTAGRTPLIHCEESDSPRLTVGENGELECMVGLQAGEAEMVIEGLELLPLPAGSSP